jgi:hypothetical protein
MKAALLFIVGLFVLGGARAEEKDAANPFELPMSPVPLTQIDKLVAARLQRLGIQPARVCSDAVFVRRVYLDVIGTLPTAEEARAFLDDTAMNKRRALIDRLLEREEFADYWAMRWSDLLRVKAEFPINLWPNAVQAYHRWIRTSIAQNKPYDRFARELLTASGSNFRVGPVNFYRAMQNKTSEGIAKTVALTFMGARTDKWPKDRLDGMAAFFTQVGYKSTAEWKEEIVFFDLDKPAPEKRVYPDGMATQLAPDRDPREAFADWLCTPKNPWFTAAICNRAWSWLMGRGIIHEVDDIRTGNAPCNGDLLCHLRDELIAARYDLKHLFRLILNSRTYQASSIPASGHPEAEANFAHYPMRRLEAEVLIDALNQITGGTEKYASPIPEPFTFIPEDIRSVALADGSITSPFLELFGRSQRDTGMESERNNRVSAAQRLHLLNSSHIQKKLEQGPRLQELLRSKDPLPAKTTSLYLAILSRRPTPAELKIVEEYTRPSSGPNPPNAPLDTAWALINTAEFLYRH